MRLPPQIRSSRPARRGVALVMFIVLAFAFFAIAGIAIDVGLASLTQQQMQVAVDPAALEGVRLRDYNVYQHLSDPHRRPKVSNLVRLVFDDDLRPTRGTQASPVVNAVPADDADTMNLGAGPLLRVDQPGDGPMAPGGVLATGGFPENTQTTTWDDPILQGNQLPSGSVGNYEFGDMVSGTFVDGASSAEDQDYHREDFVRADPEQTSPGGASWKALGFLVRMRRTPGTNLHDDSPGKSSRGPTLPFVWARGSLMTQATGDDWDPRRDGITVRATAIAVARPALRASPAPLHPNGQPIESESPDHRPMLGLHAMAISMESWTSLHPGEPWDTSITTFTIGSGGALIEGGEIRGYRVRPSQVTSVGRPMIADTTVGLPTSLRPGYVAIYARIPAGTAGTDRIVGYGFCDVSGNATTVSLRRGIAAPGSGATNDVYVWVAANGVSAQIGPDTPGLSVEDWNEVFRQNRILAFGGSNNGPDHDVVYDHTRIRPGTLLAPALAR